MKGRIMVDGVAYRRESSDGERMRIVIVDNRGLTFVGRCDLSGNSEQVVIRDAQCIIYWGTKHHLAELVAGPTSDTKLGAREDFNAMRSQIIGYYDVNEGAWL